MTSIELTAHAKVNLLLKVLGKRRDSYHDILTIFERISLADKITISKIPAGIRVSSDKFITKDPRDNIVYKAAELILKYSKVKGGVNIAISKKTPIAGGLGGGSSDAASALIGINRLYGLKLDKPQLMRLGSKLGADVPFFILNEKLALGRGIGDRLRPLKTKKVLWHLLINPGFHVPTKDIYRELDKRPKNRSKCLTTSFPDAKIHSLSGRPMDFGTIEPMLHNDLESVVVAKKAVLGNIIKRLAALLGKKAIVSGSGPSVFCLYRTRKEAERARVAFLKSLPARNRDKWQAFVVRTC
jgi:4-diphosphocytidyl-2-C-methyl-D-erythritol kinase